MDKNQLLNRLVVAEKHFTGEQFQTVVSLARKSFDGGNFKACEEMVTRLPTVESLLAALIHKLEGKSIYRTLEKIHKNEAVDPFMKLKGLSSLITHTVIEMEKGGVEYGLILPSLMEKAQALLYEL